MSSSRARSKDAIEFARHQRKTANEFAEVVWGWVRNRRLFRQKFRREFPIPPYTVDFCCVDLRLIVEVDGKDHLTEEGRRHDEIRDRILRNKGFKILRIDAFDTIRPDSDALRRLEKFVQENLCRGRLFEEDD